MAFAWYGAQLICGQCHSWLHCDMSKNDHPVEFRAQCKNPKCTNFGKLFKLDTKHAIPLLEIADSIMDQEMKEVVR